MPIDPLARFCRDHGLHPRALAELRALVDPIEDASDDPSDHDTVIVVDPSELSLQGDPTINDVPDPDSGATVGLDGTWLPSGEHDQPATSGASFTALPMVEPGVYQDLGLIGRGSTAEVRRVKDLRLDRTVAQKVIWGHLMDDPRQVRLFLEEARTAARLDHPGTLPILELGRRRDGRLYFTMPEIRGRTLASAIREVHAASGPDGWREGRSGWTFRRLIRAFQRTCEALAFAHQEGVVHRDLKPDNIMVSGHDVVLVVDWGLARRLDVHTDVFSTGRTVAGTPAYMPPEQARGDLSSVDRRSDVYALGAILYEILTGRAPYQGRDARHVLQQVLAGPPRPPGRSEGEEDALEDDPFDLASFESGLMLSGEDLCTEDPPVPLELRQVCLEAMSRRPSDRPEDAGRLMEPVRAWLDGARRRDQALELVLASDRLMPEAQRVRERARTLAESARARLASIPAWAPEHEKREAWRLDEQADSLHRHAHMLELLAEQKLQAALAHEPDLPEAHARLAERYRQSHAQAESERDEELAIRYEMILRRHVQALPESAPERARHGGYLAGIGRVAVATNPGAEVTLFRYELKNRRLVPRRLRELGPTPIRDLSLPMGSYLLLLEAPGRAPVRYPLRVEREGSWDGAPPGGGLHAIPLPLKSELGEGEIYVPAGWFEAGGDADAVDAVPARRVWIDGFVMDRDPVTTRAFLAFLDDLSGRGQLDRALELAPRAASGDLLVVRNRAGHFQPLPDTVLHPDAPIVDVTWLAARAYAAWMCERTGQPWRLPSELEWEKAARGVDGRLFPWGDYLDPSWAVVGDSHANEPRLVPVEVGTVDVSPYGVRGMGGNTQDWCLEAWDADGPPGERLNLPDVSEVDEASSSRVYRGGHWRSSHRMARCAARHHRAPDARFRTLGFRLARSWPAQAMSAEDQEAA